MIQLGLLLLSLAAPAPQEPIDPVYVYGRVMLSDFHGIGPNQPTVRVRIAYSRSSGGVAGKPLRCAESDGDLYCFAIPRKTTAYLTFEAADYEPTAPVTVTFGSGNTGRVKVDKTLVRKPRRQYALNAPGEDLSDPVDQSLRLYNVEAFRFAARKAEDKEWAAKIADYKRSALYAALSLGQKDQIQAYASVAAIIAGESDGSELKDLASQSPIIDLARGRGGFETAFVGVRAKSIEAWSRLPKPVAPSGFVKELLAAAKEPANPLSAPSLLALARTRPAEVDAETMAYIDRALNPSNAGEVDRRTVASAIAAVLDAPLRTRFPLVASIAGQDPDAGPFDAEIVGLARRESQAPGKGEQAGTPLWQRVATVVESGVVLGGLKDIAKDGDDRLQGWRREGRGQEGGYIHLEYTGHPRNGYYQIYFPSPDPERPMLGGISAVGADQMVVRMRSNTDTRIGVALQGSNEQGGPGFQPLVGPLTNKFQDYFIDLAGMDPGSLSQLHVVAQFNFRGTQGRTLDIQSIYFRKRLIRL